MNLFFALLLLIAIFLILLFAAALKILFTFNSDDAKLNVTLLWLYPLVKVIITNDSSVPVLTVYLFNKNIMSKELTRNKPVEHKGKTNRLDLVRQVKPKDVNVHAAYGFRDPSITGVTCGALGILSKFINIKSLDQDPDFATDNDYIYLDATAKLNIGSTLVNLIKTYIRKPAGQIS